MESQVAKSGFHGKHYNMDFGFYRNWSNYVVNGPPLSDIFSRVLSLVICPSLHQVIDLDRRA